MSFKTCSKYVIHFLSLFEELILKTSYIHFFMENELNQQLWSIWPHVTCNESVNNCKSKSKKKFVVCIQDPHVKGLIITY